MDVWAEIEEARKGRTVVFTNGVFDVLHTGHLSLLLEAKSMGDVLVVGLNSDASARRLGKGPDRPINTLSDRAALVGALKPVDFVVPFDEDTPIETLERLRPDVHVKGGDYDADALPETPTVQAYGGRVVIVPLVAGRSSTDTIRRMGKE